MSPASAQTTVTGTVKDAAGQPLSSGIIVFQLSQEGTVSDPALLVANPVVTCAITAGVIQSPCSLRGNDQISPAGTFYRVRIISSRGREFLPERSYSITGATWDIGAATPLASDTIAAQAYQIVQDEGTNVTQRQKLNFAGAGVTCVDNSTDARTDCTISGGGGGADQTVREADGAPAIVAAIEEFDQADGFVLTQPVSGTARIDLVAVPDSVLAQITTAGKVSGAALTLLGNVPAGAGTLPDANIPAAIARDSELHSQTHTLDGADHTASGLTTGNVIRATGPTTFAFQVIQPSDLGSGFLDVTSDIASGLCVDGQIFKKVTGAWACAADDSGGGTNHNLLSSTHTDTTAAAVVRGDLMVGQTATPVWQRLAIGGANTFLGSDGTDAAWTALVLAGAQFANQGSTTQVLHGNAAGNPSWGAVSLTADVSGVLPGANGGTNNAFMAFTGPAASLKTFTLPNASSTILTDNAAVTPAQGGTGLDSSGSTGVARVNSGTWSFDADISHLASSTSANLRGTLSDETGTGAAVFSSPTAFTLDVEAGTNAVTTVTLEEFPAATCIGAAATINWDDSPSLTEPAAACVAGTNITYGVADFDAATDEGMQFSFILPTGWTSTIDFDFYWHAAATSGSVVWALETICVADAETLDPAFSAAQTVTDAAQGTANQLNNATISSVTTTGCAAGERMFLELSRDANNGSDDMTGDARLVSTRITLRRTQ